jgi:hypothetical protein
MLSPFPSAYHLDESQYQQIIQGFQSFYPDLTVCSEKPNIQPSENKKSSNLTILTQNGKQIRFTNKQFLLDDNINSM